MDTSSTSTASLSYPSSPAMPLVHGRSSSTSSLNLLSSAFPSPATKRSPRLSATQSEIHASTANTFEDLLLQPKQTSGSFHGAFTDQESNVPRKDQGKKVRCVWEIEQPNAVPPFALMILRFLFRTIFVLTVNKSRPSYHNKLS